jgi:hypothetical protein
MTPKQSRLMEGALGLFIAAECVANAALHGILNGGDGGWYIAAGDDLLAHHFNVFHFYRAMPTSPPAVCYTLLPLLIAFAKAIAPASWRVLILLVNTAATACAGVLTVRLASRYVGALAGAAAAAGFVASIDVIAWSGYILTDSLFLGVATVAIYLMMLALLRNSLRHAAAAGAVLFVALFTRPVAPLLLVPYAVVLLAIWRLRSRSGDGAREIRRLTLGFIALMPCFLLLSVAAITYVAREHISFTPIRDLVSTYRSGVVIIGRPETWSHPGTGFGSFLATLLRRLAAFFSVTAAQFSRRHVIFALLYFVPLYATAAVGVVALLARRARAGSEEVIMYVALLAACAMWINHALVIIDYDWRYRLPMMPLLLLLSAFGVTSLQRAAKMRRPAAE